MNSIAKEVIAIEKIVIIEATDYWLSFAFDARML